MQDLQVHVLPPSSSAIHCSTTYYIDHSFKFLPTLISVHHHRHHHSPSSGNLVPRSPFRLLPPPLLIPLLEPLRRSLLIYRHSYPPTPPHLIHSIEPPPTRSHMKLPSARFLKQQSFLAIANTNSSTQNKSQKKSKSS